MFTRLADEDADGFKGGGESQGGAYQGIQSAAFFLAHLFTFELFRFWQNVKYAMRK